MSKVDERNMSRIIYEGKISMVCLTAGWLLCQLRLHRSQPAKLVSSNTPQFKEISP